MLNKSMIEYTVMALLNKFSTTKSQKGVTMIEYGLIAGLVSVVVIAALLLMSGSLETIFDAIASALGSAD